VIDSGYHHFPEAQSETSQEQQPNNGWGKKGKGETAIFFGGSNTRI
jgi:hypothetical protein